MAAAPHIRVGQDPTPPLVPSCLSRCVWPGDLPDMEDIERVVTHVCEAPRLHLAL